MSSRKSSRSTTRVIFVPQGGGGKQKGQKRVLFGSVKPVAVLTTSLPYRLTIGLMLALVLRSKKI
jgi:hypothetical protein